MTLFGILWFCIILWGFTKKNIKYMFSLTLLFMTFQCDNVIVIGGRGIGPQILTSLAFIIKTLFGYKGKILYGRKYLKFIFFSFLIVFVATISCMVNRILNEQILYLLQLLIYVLCFICIMLFYGEIDEATGYNSIRQITIFLLVVGILQVMTTMGILPLRSILQVLFYNDSAGADDIFFYRDSYNRIASTFQEPSYFSVFLVGSFYYFLSQNSRWRENMVLMAVMLMELLATTSSTGYGTFLVIGILFILANDKVKLSWKIAIVIVAVIGFAVFYLGFNNILDTVIFSKFESGSGVTRSRMNSTALAAYESSKMWGVGYKNTRGSSIIYSLLGQIGICGLIAYMLFNAVMLLPVFVHRNTKQSEYHVGCVFALAAAMVCQIIACPDLDLCSYWFWVYITGVSIKCSIRQGFRDGGIIICKNL